jgi:hypothetical protein
MPAARPDLCRAASVRGYPTWIVGGQRHEGVLSLARLAELSRFVDPAAR